MDIDFITDCQKFWDTVKPYFKNKSLTQNKIILIEDDKIISNNQETAEIINEYFINITDSLSILAYQPSLDNDSNDINNNNINDHQDNDEIA